MKTTTTDVLRDGLLILLALVLLGGLLSGCADMDGPTAPTAPTAAMADAAPTFVPAAPDTSTLPVSPVAFDGLRPDIQEGYNAYNFGAAWNGSILRIALEADEMRSMREASKPHRNRWFTAWICPTEPHHILQSCGDPILQQQVYFIDTNVVYLQDVPLPSCDGWIVVQGDELSDDKYIGWRNAPCPRPDGESISISDGSSGPWTDYDTLPHDDPRRNEADPGLQKNTDATGRPFDPAVLKAEFGPAPEWYDDTFYGQLVHNEAGRPRIADSRVVPNPETYNFVQSLRDPGGNCNPVPAGDLTLNNGQPTFDVVNSIDSILSETAPNGRMWENTASFATSINPDPGLQVGTILIRVSSATTTSTGETVPDGALGSASVGDLAGLITLYANPDNCRLRIPDISATHPVLLHEIGHVFGFYHTEDPDSALHHESTAGIFSRKDRLHMMHAYRLGRGSIRIEGWPGGRRP